MKYRCSLLVFLVLFMSSLISANPNVLFIVIDDLRSSLGAYGDSLAKTPHMDRLAEEGIRFDRAYCQQSVCNPSRASFMTGMRPDYLGVYDNRVHFRKNHPDIQTLPEYMKAQGYLTFGIGKIFHDHDWGFSCALYVVQKLCSIIEDLTL